MPSTLASQRCFHHPVREAAVRCPGCRRFFCRECVAEHGARMLCAQCLSEQAPQAVDAARRWHQLFGWIPAAAGALVAVVFFYALGRFLLTLPAAYHEGTIWRSGWERLTQ